MKTMHCEAGCWPTPQQEMLLRASLLRGSGAIDAWHQWKSSIDIDQLDPDSQRLLPTLYRNLLIHEVNDPLIAKLKGVYRHTWYKNQNLFRKMASILRSFHHAGIETLLLRGMALAVLHYKDYGARPMDGLHVCVRGARVPAAVRVLNASGWTPTSQSPEALVSFRPSSEFIDPDGQRFNLHWHLFSGCQATSNSHFWDGAVLTEIGNVPTYALHPTDQLLHVCVHGAIGNGPLSFRWVADAMTILNSSDTEIDWGRLATQVAIHRLILPLRDTLGYLREALGAPVPATILKNIRNAPTSIMERVEYRARVRHSKGLPGLLVQWLTYSRMSCDDGLPGRIVGFAKYLQYAWGVDRLWKVPLHLLLRALRRLLKMPVRSLTRSARTS